jgi:mannose-6-phosphate isomerase-like protein (cupin superfamily)
MSDTIDPMKNYLLLEADGNAVPLPGGDEFWRQLMSGKPEDQGIQRLMESEHGRLLSVIERDADWVNWEMHPAGDEILMVLKGEMTLVFEEGTEERLEKLTAGRLAVVPKGVWHTARLDGPVTLLALTDGMGTEHRPA